MNREKKHSQNQENEYQDAENRRKSVTINMDNFAKPQSMASQASLITSPS